MTEADDERGRARVLLVQGDLEQKAGDLDASAVSLEQAIDRFRSLGDDQGTADGLRGLGMTLMFQDQNVAAEATFTDALELYKQVGDRRGEAWALQNLAWLAFSQGRTDRADAWLQESAATFGDIGDNGGLGWALGLLAWVRFHQGQFAESEQLAEQILEEARERGDRWAAGMMLVLVAALRVWTGRAAAALEPAQEAREVFASMSDWYGHGNSLGVLARALVASGRVEEAFSVLDELALIEDNRPDPWTTVITALTAAQVGLPERASHLDPAAFAELGDPGQIGFTDALVAFGLIRLQEGDPAGALALLGPAVDQAPSTNPHALSSSALALAAAGRVDEAIARADEVDRYDGGTYADRCHALIAKGLATAQRGDVGGVVSAFDAARALVDPTDDVVARALVRLAESVARAAVGDASAAAVADEADALLADLGLRDTKWRIAFELAASGAGIAA